MTNPNYQVYQGVDFTATKRYSNRWQMQAALTLQTNPQYFPDGSATFINPTGQEFRDGYSTIRTWNVQAERQLHASRGTSTPRRTSMRSRARHARRRSTVPGPFTAASTRPERRRRSATTTLEAEPRGSDPVRPVNLLDLGVQKVAEVREPVSAQAGAGRLQHHEHQHHHRLLERQPQPGRLHPADGDHRARASSASAAGSPSRANPRPERGIRAYGPGSPCHLFAA